MKRTAVICTLCLTILPLGGCAQEQSKIEYIGAENAKASALEAAGLSADQVEFSGTDMSTRNGVDYYEVAFAANGENYQYSIDALTGVVIDSQTPQDDSALPSPAEQTDPAVLPTDLENPGAPIAVPLDFAEQNSDPEEAMISEEEARNKALEHAGLQADQVTFIKSGLDWDDGWKTYDVEFYTADQKEYDYDIDPYSGQVLTYDLDAEYYTPQTAGSGNGSVTADKAAAGGGNSSITADEAKALALAQVPGAAASDIREFETDYDDGRLEYEGKIYYDQMEYEFEIDGYSGAIRSWEVESIYD